MGFLSSIAGLATGAISSFTGGWIGDYFNKKSASRQNSYNLYQTSTAHQREVRDLKAAGLNPILSALGSGASTLPVAVQSSGNAVAENIGKLAQSRFRREDELAVSQMRKNEADVASAKAVAVNQLEQAKSQENQRVLSSANAALALAEKKKAEAAALLADAQRLRDSESARASKRRNDWFERLRSRSEALHDQAVALEMFGSSAASIATGQALGLGTKTSGVSSARVLPEIDGYNAYWSKELERIRVLRFRSQVDEARRIRSRIDELLKSGKNASERWELEGKLRKLEREMNWIGPVGRR